MMEYFGLWGYSSDEEDGRMWDCRVQLQRLFDPGQPEVDFVLQRLQMHATILVLFTIILVWFARMRGMEWVLASQHVFSKIVLFIGGKTIWSWDH